MGKRRKRGRHHRNYGPVVATATRPNKPKNKWKGWDRQTAILTDLEAALTEASSENNNANPVD